MERGRGMKKEAKKREREEEEAGEKGGESFYDPCLSFSAELIRWLS
jgi:hypothetical protein